MAISVSFPVLLSCSTGGRGPASLGAGFLYRILFLTRLIPNWSIGGLEPTLLGAGFLYRILSPTGLVSKLTDFLSSLSYIIIQHPPSSCGRHKLHSFKPSIVKATLCYSSTGCTCYWPVHFLVWLPGRVVGQYTTFRHCLWSFARTYIITIYFYDLSRLSTLNLKLFIY